jgi:CPA2 family monovalent cation:H+ antiporter-2
LRDAFAVLFFVSVGMLFDPAVIWNAPIKLLAVVAIIMVGKTLAAVALVLAFRYPLNTALTVGASLAQIGEFSFILAGLGLALGLLPTEGQSLVLAGALIAIAANSALFVAIDPLRTWVLARSATARRMEHRADPLAELPADTPRDHLAGHVVLVGHGEVGARLAQALAQQGLPFVVAEQHRATVDTLRAQGWQAVSGDAASPDVLVQAHIAEAAMLVVTTSDPVAARQMVATAQTLNPAIAVVLRGQNAEESALLQGDCQGHVFMAEEALAQQMAGHIVAAFRPQPKTTAAH